MSSAAVPDVDVGDFPRWITVDPVTDMTYVDNPHDVTVS
jgi:hypothetical protein